jgi:DNA repair protein RadC
MESLPLKDWSMEDHPKFKLLQKGLGALTNSELLSILINTGTHGKSALKVSQDLLKVCKNNLAEIGKLSLSDIKRVKGIGESKAMIVIAAIELGRRRYSTPPIDRRCIKNSCEIAEYLKIILQDYNYEVFGVIYLNRANKIKHFEIISRGGISGTVADPRLILKQAIEQEATSIILTHNHPSGNLQPSRADEDITSKIKLAASYLDIKVLDHIIVSEDGYYSFADEGMI